MDVGETRTILHGDVFHCEDLPRGRRRDLWPETRHMARDAPHGKRRATWQETRHMARDAPHGKRRATWRVSTGHSFVLTTCLMARCYRGAIERGFNSIIMMGFYFCKTCLRAICLDCFVCSSSSFDSLQSCG
jgi:hypothetical protein